MSFDPGRSFDEFRVPLLPRRSRISKSCFRELFGYGIVKLGEDCVDSLLRNCLGT
jgi:hypothetical protein